ncbi:hypothetical protein EI94DRAFT_1739536 [Lactarius quietus]|nr:hypothetical protein EI94DRAFT_1739536 [Lactarius quietus]
MMATKTTLTTTIPPGVAAPTLENPTSPKFASSFAQRIGSFVRWCRPSQTSHDYGLEHNTERGRECTRREVERILTRGAEDRRLIEEKVFSMLHTTHGSTKQVSPARSRSVSSFECLPQPPLPT